MTGVPQAASSSHRRGRKLSVEPGEEQRHQQNHTNCASLPPKLSFWSVSTRCLLSFFLFFLLFHLFNSFSRASSAREPGSSVGRRSSAGRSTQMAPRGRGRSRPRPTSSPPHGHFLCCTVLSAHIRTSSCVCTNTHGSRLKCLKRFVACACL